MKRKVILIAAMLVALSACAAISQSGTELSVQERSLDPFGVKYPYLQSTDISSVSEEINTEIYTFLSEYCSSFAEGSEFNLEYKIMKNDGELISVLFSGSVFTPAKAMAQAFAMNFDAKNGKLMALDDFHTEKEILDELGAGNFEIDYGEESEYTVPPEIAFDTFRIITGDEHHRFDFFFDTEYLYIIVARDAPEGYYAVYKTHNAPDYTLHEEREEFTSETGEVYGISYAQITGLQDSELETAINAEGTSLFKLNVVHYKKRCTNEKQVCLPLTHFRGEISAGNQVLFA